MVATAAAHDDGPIAFRFPRGEGSGVDLPERGIPLEIGKGRMIKRRRKVALLSFGTRLAEVEKAAEALAAKGITPTIADARFAKPLDRDLILDLAANHDALITIEEGAVGGLAAMWRSFWPKRACLTAGLNTVQWFCPIRLSIRPIQWTCTRMPS